jgi:hypothetical protein
MARAAITDDCVSIRCIGDDMAFLIGTYIDVLGRCNGKGIAILATMSFITIWRDFAPAPSTEFMRMVEFDVIGRSRYDHETSRVARQCCGPQC